METLLELLWAIVAELRMRWDPEILEGVWVVMATATLMAHLWGVRDGRIDIRALERQAANGTLRFAAHGQIWISTLLALVQLREIYFGVSLLFASSRPTEFSWDTAISVVLIFIGEALLMSVSFGVIQFRRELRRRRAVRIADGGTGQQ